MEPPSSKERKGQIKREERKGNIFDPGRYLQCSTEQLSALDLELSFERASCSRLCSDPGLDGAF